VEAIEKRIDHFLMTELATFERKNRGRQTSELDPTRKEFAERWDALCIEAMRSLPRDADRNEVESRLVSASKEVTGWWDYGWRVTRSELEDFLDRLRERADAIQRILRDLPNRKAVATVERRAGRPRKGTPTINDRMKLVMIERRESIEWTAEEWALHLTCAKSSITDTPTWDALKVTKADAQIKRLKNRTGKG
jgi:hypothetical protein